MIRFNSNIKSPLPNVSDDAWAKFVSALEVQPVRSISKSGGFGAFDIRPRRLAELGYVTNLRPAKNEKRQIYDCDFVPPLTKTKFLSNMKTQYEVFAKSMELYFKDLKAKKIDKPKDISTSEALVVLHLGGKGALKAWPNLFQHTKSLCDSVQGVF